MTSVEHRARLRASSRRIAAASLMLSIVGDGLASIIAPNLVVFLSLVAAVAAMAGLLWSLREEAVLADRLETLTRMGSRGSSPMRITTALARLAEAADIRDARWARVHRVTGLATREPLLAQIAQCSTGTLGIIAFADFARICAFDPAMADRLLQVLGQRLRKMIGSERLLAHIDRSHFALWFGTEASEAEAEAELAAILYALRSPIVDAGHRFEPELCSRQAVFQAGVEQPHEFLARLIASCAVQPPDSIATTSAVATTAAVKEQYTLEQALRRAIGDGQLELLFQPQIDAAAGGLSGAEALLRWRHPERGLISPSLFIPIAEQAGMIEAFGMWALNASCREAARWRAAGFGQFRVAVNVSGHQLDSSDMLGRIERTLARHRLTPMALDIELTESAATRDLTKAGALFETLRSRGIEIAIDDFGTGFSSLTALRSLAFDKIKIDRAFVTEVHRRRDSQAICQSIIALGRGLGIRVLAEGVETREEYAWLRRHGCSEFQGFYFARPLEGDAFLTFAREPTHLTRLLDLGPQAERNLIEKRL